MKKHQTIVSLAALAFALAALAIALLALGAVQRDAELLQTLVAENADLRHRLDQLRAESTQPEAEATCTMVVDGWESQDLTLTLTSAFVHVQLPQGSTLTVSDARLVLSQSGRTLCSHPVRLLPGEGESSFEAFPGRISLTPEEGAQEGELLLTLEVTLSDGTALRSEGGSWYISDGQIFAAVG